MNRVSFLKLTPAVVMVTGPDVGDVRRWSCVVHDVIIVSDFIIAPLMFLYAEGFEQILIRVRVTFLLYFPLVCRRSGRFMPHDNLVFRGLGFSSSVYAHFTKVVRFVYIRRL